MIKLLVLLLFPVIAFAGESMSVKMDTLTIHGLKPSAFVANNLLKNKLDEAGRAIFTPGITIGYNNDDLLFSVGFLRDCYANPALALMVGKEFETSLPGLSWSVVGGIYLRRSPDFCSSTGCFVNKDMPVEFKTTVIGNKIDIFPMLFLGVNYALPINYDTDFEISFYSNFFLNHALLGFRRYF